MDFSHYSDEPVEIAVNLVNTYDVVAGEDALETPHDVAEFLATLDDWADGAPQSVPDERDLRDVRALRSRLRAVFDAVNAAEAATELNTILGDVAATPRVSLHGDRPHLHFECEGDRPARWLGAVTAMGLSVALIEGGFDRFGTCASETCDDVFVDVSRNRSRRHCSETCTTRENVAAYRRRQRND